MKRFVPLVLLIGLGGVGCLPVQVQQRPPQAQLEPVAEPRAVLPEEVNEQNAAEMARALGAEIRGEAARRRGPAADEKKE